MSTFRVGNHWRRHTIILEGVLPADAQGRREDDRPVAFVDSAAPEGLAERICALLNGDERDDAGSTPMFGHPSPGDIASALAVVDAPCRPGLDVRLEDDDPEAPDAGGGS